MADKLVLNEAEVREYIGRLEAVVQILDSLPEFLKGDNKQGQSIWLKKVELGNYEPFKAAWDEICASRTKEAKTIAAFLEKNKEKLVKAAEKITGTDMDSAALFPPTVTPGLGDKNSLESGVERQGLGVITPKEAKEAREEAKEKATIDRLGRNIPR